MEAATSQRTPTAQEQEIARRRERLEQSRREFLETVNRQRGPSRGEVVEQRDGFTRVTIVRGDVATRIPAAVSQAWPAGRPMDDPGVSFGERSARVGRRLAVAPLLRYAISGTVAVLLPAQRY